MREQAKRLVVRAGLEKPARAVMEAREARRPARKRDKTDNEHLGLLLAFLLDERSNCIDIGANHGFVLDRIVGYAPKGQHLAYEPVPQLAAELRERFPTVDVRSIALSNETGTARFSHVRDSDGLSGLQDRGLEGRNVEHIDVLLARLDDDLPPDYRPDFIKIDVEGAEYHLLEGAERVLSEYHPPIWLEHGEDASSFYGVRSTDVWDQLCGQHGYRIVDADGRGPLSRSEFADCLGRMWNFLAR